MFRNIKLSYTRCFLPAILFKKNEYDVDGTEVLNKTKVGGWQGVKDAFKNE